MVCCCSSGGCQITVILIILKITGTDSRLGWGFRLGDRADFQVMLEIGPQTNTQPLANQGDGNSNSKRNTMDSLTETLYAQRQHEKKQKEQKLRKEKKKEKVRKFPYY